jgi:hypothetical protein
VETVPDATRRLLRAVGPDHGAIQAEMAEYAAESGFPIVGPESGGVLRLLAAVAAAQVQSVFVSGFAAAGYFARDAVSLPLAALVGVPELLGVLVGWRVAHRVPAVQLKRVLAVVLVCLGPYVALTS